MCLHGANVEDRQRGIDFPYGAAGRQRVAGRITARAQRQGDAGERIVAAQLARHGEIQARIRLFADGARLDRGHHAGDAHFASQIVNAAADGVLPGEGAIGKGLVDDGDVLGGRPGGEVAFRDHADAEGRKKARRDGIDVGVQRLLRIRGVAFRSERVPGAGEAEGDITGEGGGLHAGDGARACKDGVQQTAGGIRRVAVEAGIEPQQEDAAVGKAGVDAPGGIQAAQEEAGRNQQHHGDGYLSDHQQVARAEAGRLESAGNVAAGGAQGGREAEDEAGKGGKGRREEHHTIVGGYGEVDRQGDREARAGKRGGAGQRQGIAAGAAGQGEQDALGEQLAHEPGASGADGQAGGDLPAAGRGARQQQIGNVGAGREEHQHGHHQQHQEEGDEELAGAGVDLAGTLQVKAAVLVGCRIGGPQAVANHPDFGGRGLGA